MNLTVIRLTKEVDSMSDKDLEDARICYMKDSYFNYDVSSGVKALKHFVRGSTADHVRVKVLSVPKYSRGTTVKDESPYLNRIQLKNNNIKTIGACKESCRWFKEQDVFTRLI